MGGRWVIGVLLAAQVGLVVAGLAVWAWVPGAPPPPTIEPQAAQTWPASLESASPVAAAAAAAWLPEARLMHAALQIDWPWQAPPAGETQPVAATGWVDYVFAAPWVSSGRGPGRPPGGATLSLLAERLTGEIVVAETTAWEAMPQLRVGPPPAVTSLDAAAAAEAAGGAEFRHACPVQRHVSRVSLVMPPGEPAHWLVTYEDVRQRNRHGLIVTVDASTGEASVTGGTAPECPDVLD